MPKQMPLYAICGQLVMVSTANERCSSIESGTPINTFSKRRITWENGYALFAAMFTIRRQGIRIVALPPVRHGKMSLKIGSARFVGLQRAISKKNKDNPAF